MAKFAAKDSNKNITLSPHGTGKVVVGTGAADATVQEQEMMQVHPTQTLPSHFHSLQTKETLI